MIAQRKYEEVRSFPVASKRRKKVSPAVRLFENPMVAVIVVAFLLCLCASTYVSAYARCSEKGCSRAKLVSDLSRIKKENESLRLQIAELRQPERIEAFAKESNMQQCQKTAYLEPIEPSAAQNTASIDIR